MVFVDDGGQAALLIGTAGRGGRAEAAVTLGLCASAGGQRKERGASCLQRLRNREQHQAEKYQEYNGRMALQWSHQAEHWKEI